MFKGLDEIKDSLTSGADYLKLKDGEAVTMRILVPKSEIIGVYEHTEQFGGRWKTVTCLGKDKCPLCLAGKKASFKAYIPFLDTATDKVKIFKASKDATKLIIGLVDEYGELTQNTFKLLRTGEKLDTSYQFFYKKDDREYNLADFEIPDIEELIRPLPRESVIALMEGGASAAQAVSNGTGAVDTEPDLPF